ncbi:hypothetical protein ACOMCU_01700 [Lysinibacillus sp. UGB7]|uniref:hypothetical protein n=1 Tax=Lysinibacillus sp. UGB7 TaxID=3411039 RepID=UPI003B7C7577
MELLDGLGYVLVIIMLGYLLVSMLNNLKKTCILLYWTIKLDNEAFLIKEAELKEKWGHKKLKKPKNGND